MYDMKRSQFLKGLSVLPFIAILGCNSYKTNQPNLETQTNMASQKGIVGGTAIVSYKIVDKDGNVKTVVKNQQIEVKQDQKVK